jgi:hypothetical protein
VSKTELLPFWDWNKKNDWGKIVSSIEELNGDRGSSIDSLIKERQLVRQMREQQLGESA